MRKLSSAAAATATGGIHGRTVKPRPRRRVRRARTVAKKEDISKNAHGRLQLLPFCQQDFHGSSRRLDLSHRVWVDNLPYDSSFADIVEVFGNISPLVGTTLYRPPLAMALLMRRRRAEYDALEHDKLQRMCEVARNALAAAHNTIAEQQDNNGAIAPPAPRRRRGRPRESDSILTDDTIEGSGIDSQGTVRPSNRSLEITRYGDLTGIRCFGFLHLESLRHKEQVLSRSLQIFGVSFQTRTCPTVDERAKKTVYLETMPRWVRHTKRVQPHQSAGSLWRPQYPTDGVSQRREAAAWGMIKETAGPVAIQWIQQIHFYDIDSIDAEYSRQDSNVRKLPLPTASTATGLYFEDLTPVQFLVEFRDNRSATMFLERVAGPQMTETTILPDGTMLRARWADALEERHIYSYNKKEAEILNDEE